MFKAVSASRPQSVNALAPTLTVSFNKGDKGVTAGIDESKTCALEPSLFSSVRLLGVILLSKINMLEYTWTVMRG